MNKTTLLAEFSEITTELTDVLGVQRAETLVQMVLDFISEKVIYITNQLDDPVELGLIEEEQEIIRKFEERIMRIENHFKKNGTYI